jgi:hypothetical protein
MIKDLVIMPYQNCYNTSELVPSGQPSKVHFRFDLSINICSRFVLKFG